MATVGEATIKLAFDGKSLKASADKEAPKIQGALGKVGDMAKSAGKGLGKAVGLGLTAAAGAGIAAIAKIGGEAVTQFAEYEQLVGGVETLFKNSADTVFKYADQAYKTAGLSANQYMAQATAFSASLLQSVGGNTRKAADTTNMAIIDMADNANKMGTSLDMIQNAYQGFAKQNYTMLDNLKLGYGGTKTEMERLLKDAQKISGVKYDIKNLNDVFQAIHVIQGQLGITGTTAKEAGTTIQGSAGMVKAAWQNLVTGIADDTQDFNKLLDNFITSIGTLGKNIIPVIKVAMKGVVRLIKDIVPQIVKELPGLIKELLPSLVEATVLIAVEIAKMLPELMPIIVDGLVLLVTALIPKLPTIFLALINGIIQIFQELTKPENINLVVMAMLELLRGLLLAIPQIIDALATAIPDIITNIIAWLCDPEALAMLIDAAVMLFMGLVMAVPKIATALFSAFIKLFSDLWKKLQNVFTDFAGKFGNAIGRVFKNAVNGVFQFLEGFINTPINAINGMIDAINSIPGVEMGKLATFQFPRLAKGGVTTGSTFANIGEAGAEAVIPLERNTDTWAGPLARAIADQFSEQGIGGAAGVTVYMTNNINNNLDADEIGQRLMTSIRRAA